jgi:hypothetical protein
LESSSLGLGEEIRERVGVNTLKPLLAFLVGKAAKQLAQGSQIAGLQRADCGHALRLSSCLPAADFRFSLLTS